MNRQYEVCSKQYAVGSILALYCFLLTACCLLFIVACGHTPPTLSDAHLKAIELNQRGEHAFKKGDYKRALNFYSEALKVNRTIENIDGIAINLINTAIVYHKIGDKDNAHICVDEILNKSSIAYSPFRLSEAAFIKAILYIDDGKYNPALEWTDKALSFCKNADCLTEGRIYNLKAKIVLLKENPNSAIN